MECHTVPWLLFYNKKTCPIFFPFPHSCSSVSKSSWLLLFNILKIFSHFNAHIKFFTKFCPAWSHSTWQILFSFVFRWVHCGTWIVTNDIRKGKTWQTVYCVTYCYFLYIQRILNNCKALLCYLHYLCNSDGVFFLYVSLKISVNSGYMQYCID